MTFESKPTENKFYTSEIRFETVINKAFANYKKIALYAGLALFVFFFMLIIVATALSTQLIGAENINEKSMMHFQKLLITPPFLWYYTGFSVLLGSFLSPFMAGFYKMADAAEKDISFGVRDLFSYYSSPLFFSLFGVTFLISFITNGLNIFFDQIGFPFVGLLLGLLINFTTLLTIPFIIFGNKNTFEAIQTSIQITLKQAWVIFLLVFVGFIGALLGLFAFCIGIIFTYPFLISIVYQIYIEITATPSE
jgi:hypothetical protein